MSWWSEPLGVAATDKAHLERACRDHGFRVVWTPGRWQAVEVRPRRGHWPRHLERAWPPTGDPVADFRAWLAGGRRKGARQ